MTEKTVAPMAFNKLPLDPALEALNADLSALAEKYGYALVTIAYKQDGKMMVTDAGMDTCPGTPGALFNIDPPLFFMSVAYAMRALAAAQDIEDDRAGRA
jgi:hypothetical protein